MKAMIRLHQIPPAKKSFWSLIFLPAIQEEEARFGEETVMIYTLNSIYHRRFSKFISRIRQRCSTLYFTDDMKQFPKVYHQISTGEYFFRHLDKILAQMPAEEVADAGILCQNEDPRLIPLLEILSKFSPAVSIFTEEDAFFEKVSRSLFLSHGLSLNQKTAETMPQKRLMLLLNSSKNAPLQLGEYCIDLREFPSRTGANTLWDFTTREVSEEFCKFHIENIKHCYFVPKEDKNINLIWKI